MSAIAGCLVPGGVDVANVLSTTDPDGASVTAFHCLVAQAFGGHAGVVCVANNRVVFASSGECDVTAVVSEADWTVKAVTS